MVKEYTYVNIKEILSRILKHPMLANVTLEQAIQYTLDFIGIFGLPNTYIDKYAEVNIEEFRGKLPCDVTSIEQVEDSKSGICLRSMTGNFDGKEHHSQEASFKTQGDVIYTSFKTGKIIVYYKGLKLDDNELPLLPDNANFLKALELYIKKEVFTYLFDLGRVRSDVLQHTEQQYAWAAGQLNSEFMTPSVSEMESIGRMWNKLIINDHEFDTGFRNLGNKEYLKKH